MLEGRMLSEQLQIPELLTTIHGTLLFLYYFIFFILLFIFSFFRERGHKQERGTEGQREREKES